MDLVFEELHFVTEEISWMQMIHETGCMPGLNGNDVIDFSYL